MKFNKILAKYVMVDISKKDLNISWHKSYESMTQKLAIVIEI